MKRFEGKTVLLTGAAGGFGRAAAKRFQEEGANLVLSDHPSMPLDAFAAELGGDVAAHAGDVTEPALHRDLVKLAQDRFGGLDVAVNNAGIGHPPAKLAEVDDAAARLVIEIDLLAVFYAMKAQIPAMEGRDAAIVNVASVAGLGGAPTIGVYAAAKHGVVGLTRTAAAEYARRGLRVNAVCPGFARTPMVEKGLLEAGAAVAGITPQEAEAHLVRGVPMRRLGTPEEIAQAILFAAAPENGFMTGQALALDGGITSV